MTHSSRTVWCGLLVASVTLFPSVLAADYVARAQTRIDYGTALFVPPKASATATPTPAPTPLSVTNVQKLSLPVDTAVGTDVAVSDGFYVSGFGDARDGFYFLHPNGLYIKSFPFLDDGTDLRCNYNGDAWQIGNDALGFSVSANIDGGIYAPWQADWSNSVPPLTLTHPALQTLAVPDPSVEAHWVPTP